MRVFAEILKKNGIADEHAKMKIDGMEKRFKEHYTRLKALPLQGRHINYDTVRPSESIEGIAKVLRSEKEKKTT